ncbi:MAG: hypothetical protein HY438_00275 [DPANN group archaeon]|nr:hypothetical protein [DPANN group archaeon]
MKPYLFVLLLLAIGAVIVSQGLTNEIISSAATGSVRFFVVSSNNFFREDVQISNQTANTTFQTGLNVTLVFRTNTSSGGFLNVTAESANPVQSQPLQKESIGKFLEIQSNLSFANATIVINYDDSDVAGLDESSLRVYSINNESGNWDILPGAVNTSINEVTGLTTHFSTFGVFGGQSGTAASTGFAGGRHEFTADKFEISNAPLLDVLVDIVEGYRVVDSGSDILVTITLSNFGSPGRKDVTISYFVVDADDNELAIGKETIAVETTTSIVRKINIPHGLPSGQYRFRVVAKTNGLTVKGSSSFQVVSTLGLPAARYFSAKPASLIAAFIVIFVLGVAAVYVNNHVKKDKAVKKFLEDYERYWRRVRSNK